MADRKKTSVTINGRNFNVVSNRDEDYTRKIAYRVDESIQKIKENNNKLDYIMLAILAALNITDDYYQLEEEFESYKNESKVPIRNYDLVCKKLEEAKLNLEKSESKVKNISIELEESKSEQELLFEQIKKYKMGRTRLEDEIGELKKQLETERKLNLEKSSKSENVKKIKDKELDRLRRESVEYKAKNESLNLEISRLKEELDLKDLEKREVDSYNQAIEENIGKLEKANNNFCEELKNVKEDLKEKDREIENLKSELDEYIDLLDGMTS